MKRQFLYTLVLALLLGSCTKESSIQPDVSSLAEEVAAQSNVTGPLSEMSLYHLDSDWKNQQGEDLKLKSLQGKVQLVAMIYTKCNYACPRIVADLKRIEMSLEQYEKEDIGIVLITMDPENDTPEKLKEFSAANDLDTNRWQLLTSTDDAVQELAVLLNMKYKKDNFGNIGHSNIITVLNTGGEIIQQQEGLGKDPDETVKSIDGLLKNM